MELTTPHPVYVDPHPVRVDEKPPAMAGHEKLQAMTAAHHAKLKYPGAAGEVLAAEINAFVTFGFRGDNNSAIARLIRDLIR